jgi:hypothetical protein
MTNEQKDKATSLLYALRRDIAFLVEERKPLTCYDEDELVFKIRQAIALIEQGE